MKFLGNITFEPENIMKKILIIVGLLLSYGILAQSTISSKNCMIAFDGNYTYSDGYYANGSEKAIINALAVGLETSKGFKVTIMDKDERLRGDLNDDRTAFVETVPEGFEYAIGASLIKNNQIYIALMKKGPNNKMDSTLVSEVQFDLYAAGAREFDKNQAIVDISLSLLPNCKILDN